LAVPELKAIYLDKIKKATSSVATLQHRKSTQAGTDSEVDEALAQAEVKAVARQKERANIEGSVAILVDISGSMDVAIESAQKLLEYLAPLIKGELNVYAFNNHVRAVALPDKLTPSSIRNVFGRLRAGGGTTPAVVVDAMAEAGVLPDRIVLLSDGGEGGWGPANFAVTLANYYESMGETLPGIVFVRLPGMADSMTRTFEQNGYVLERFEVPNMDDYTILDNVGKLLAGKPRQGLYQRVLETQLPRRI